MVWSKAVSCLCSHLGELHGPTPLLVCLPSPPVGVGFIHSNIAATDAISPYLAIMVWYGTISPYLAIMVWYGTIPPYLAIMVWYGTISPYLAIMVWYGTINPFLDGHGMVQS
jgi:hypothetical protein